MHYLLGCGGVGSYLVPVLSKTFNGVTIIDGDTVEQKNLIRQNFFPNDIGHFKAERLGRRYEVNYINTFLSDKNKKKLIEPESVVFTCVDNDQGRKNIIELAKEKNLFIINGANERDRAHAFVYSPALDPNVLSRYKFDRVETKEVENDVCNTQLPDVNYFVAGMMMWLWSTWQHDIPYCFLSTRKGMIYAGNRKQEIITNFKTINLL